jgi:hypothetical protein
VTRYYLAPYIGLGTDRNPFRPLGSDATDWTAIDLRPDPTVTAGWAFLAAAVSLPDVGLMDLGEDPDDPSAARKLAVETALGLTLTGSSLRTIVPEVLIDHARTDGTRWRPLRPTGQRYDIHLGGLLYSQPALSGGSAFTETFDQTDSTTLGPTLTWTETTGNLQTVSNACRCVDVNVVDEARAEHDVGSVDHFTRFTVSIFNTPASAENQADPLCRFAAAARTHYGLRFRRGTTTTTSFLYRRVAGTVTNLTSGVTTTFSAGDARRVVIQGSTLSGFLNATQEQTVTDTVIPGGTRGGLKLVAGAATADVAVDNFEVGDLGSRLFLEPIVIPGRAVAVW